MAKQHTGITGAAGDDKRHTQRQCLINARGTLLDLSSPVIMGIINCTPDSFHSGSRVDTIDDALKLAGTMLSEGAAILDIGAASSRPGARIISADEEITRLMPFVEALRTEYPDAMLSVDTWRDHVARTALAAGVQMINDISGGRFESGIVDAVAEAGAPFIVMHSPQSPEDMHQPHTYSDVAGDVLRYFIERTRLLRIAGIKDLIIDPGFGFGKSVFQNFELLQKLDVFTILDIPLMVGISRKSMIWRTLEVSPDDALNGTSALHMTILQKGARILRVHDVWAAQQVIRLHSAIQEHGTDVSSGENH